MESCEFFDGGMDDGPTAHTLTSPFLQAFVDFQSTTAYGYVYKCVAASTTCTWATVGTGSVNNAACATTRITLDPLTQLPYVSWEQGGTSGSTSPPGYLWKWSGSAWSQVGASYSGATTRVEWSSVAVDSAGEFLVVVCVWGCWLHVFAPHSTGHPLFISHQAFPTCRTTTLPSAKRSPSKSSRRARGNLLDLKA